MATNGKIDTLINWNYIGIAAAILSILVSAYNINRYLEEQSMKKQ